MRPVPTNWVRGNIRRFAKMKTGHTPSRSVAEYWTEATIPWFTLADVWQLRDGRRTYLGPTSSRISRLGLENSAAELLPAGTVVLSRTASVGFSGVMPEAMATSQDFWNWVCGPHLLPEFLNYQFKAIAPELRALNQGSTHQTIYQKDAASIQILVPPLEVQRSITTYLDRETAQIDALIQEQQRLIDLLRERRIALISRLVRRGLNDAVDLKPSGVDWLGEVPTHWSIRRLKYSISSSQTGVWGEEPRGDEDDVLCVRVADFDRPRLRVRSDVPTVRSVPVKERLPRLLQDGDLLLEKSGGTSLSPVGFVAIFEGAERPAVSANFLARLRPAVGQHSRYWLYAHAASYSTRLTARSVKQTTGIQNLDQNGYFNERFPYPPYEEQIAIANRIDAATAKIDETITEGQYFIELSKERRAALITAAVTGQFDVREAA